MAKLSANQAAKEAGVAKKTLLDAISSGRLSAEKNYVGHWEIEPSELFRVFPKTSSKEGVKPEETPIGNLKKQNEISALEVEIKMLRHQIERMDADRERERSQLTGQIESLKDQSERQSADYRQALAVLTDQRDKIVPPAKRSLWGRLIG